jgi:hypothetical protein
MLKGSDVPSLILPKATFVAWGRAIKGHRTPFDWLSHDPAQVDAYIADPLCGFDASVSMWRDIFRLTARRPGAGAFPIRVGGADRTRPHPRHGMFQTPGPGQRSIAKRRSPISAPTSCRSRSSAPMRGDDTRALGAALRDRTGPRPDGGQARPPISAPPIKVTRPTAASARSRPIDQPQQALSTKTAGRGDVRRLVPADVLIENFKLGGLEKYGLDYESLKAINPRSSTARSPASARTAPMRRAGYDFIIQGMAGMMSITGEPGGEPQKAGVAISDIFTGLYSVIAIQAALRHARRPARASIDMALLRQPDLGARQPEPELSGLRQAARPDGQCPSEHRAL